MEQCGVALRAVVRCEPAGFDGNPDGDENTDPGLGNLDPNEHAEPDADPHSDAQANANADACADRRGKHDADSDPPYTWSPRVSVGPLLSGSFATSQSASRTLAGRARLSPHENRGAGWAPVP